MIDTSGWIIPVFDQSAYRWYDNVNATEPATPLAAENTQVTDVVSGDVLRLRMAMNITDNALNANIQDFKLQYGVGATCSAIGTWTDLGAAGSGSVWRGLDKN